MIDKLCTATRAANRLLSIFVLRLSKTDLVRLGQQADFATSLRDSLRQLLAALANVKQIDGQDINDLNSAVETFEIEVLLPLQQVYSRIHFLETFLSEIIFQRKELLEEAAERYMKG